MKRLIFYFLFFGIIAYAFLGCGAVPKSMVQLNAVNAKSLERMKQDLDAMQDAFGDLFLDYTRSKNRIVLKKIIAERVHPILIEAGFSKEALVAEVIELYDDATRNEREIMATVAEERGRKYPAYEQLKWGLALQGQSMEALNRIDYDAIFQSVDNSLPGMKTLFDRYKADKEADDTRKQERRERVWAENDRLRKEGEEQ